MNPPMKLTLLLASASLTACVLGSTVEPPPAAKSIGDYDISTIPLDASLIVRSATYMPSGKVLVSYAKDAGADRRLLSLAVMNDDGTQWHPFFSQQIPERKLDNGIREMVFPDNQRIFLGDFVIECATSLDRCENPQLVPVTYPSAVAGGPAISHRWSEIIVAPDNRHIAWTTLLANYSAMVFTGALQRQGDSYVIVSPQIVSTIDPFEPDPAHADGVLPKPVRGGEVKQFVHGGTALSLVGAGRRDVPDSVVQDLITGQLQAITDTPGYTETTIFSPDERLGITMSTRFSAKTDPAILGLLPRPYPDSLNMGLSMFAYTYAVTGVRRARQGNIGPALIDIAASKSQDNYLGIDLSADADWVYRSPMSWSPDGSKAMWLEGRRDGGSKRIRIVHLRDYKPAAAVVAQPIPDQVSYATSDLSVVKQYASDSHEIDVKVYGRHSGYIKYRRTAKGAIEKTYVDFSDNGDEIYSGSEQLQANPGGRSTYTAKIKLVGSKPGAMDLKITFGPLGGALPAEIVFDADPSGKPLTQGYAEYDGRRIDVGSLLP